MKKMILMFAMVALTIGIANGAEAKGKKMSHSQAKKECLAETPSLAGDALKTCVKEKRNK